MAEQTSCSPCVSPASLWSKRRSTSKLTSNDALAGIDSNPPPVPSHSFRMTSKKTIVVTALGDFDVENDETFFVNLSNAVGATIADDQAVGTITNDDQLLQDISIIDGAIAEGIAGTTTRAEVTVRLSGPSASPVSVEFSTANGTAIAGQDYEQSTGTITFAPGEVFRTISFDILGDARN